MSLDTISQQPVEIFISYSRNDRLFAEELNKQLKFDNRCKVWYDANLSPGGTWEKEIHSHFLSARIILLLVSPDFFNSDYCTKLEMPAALERSDAIVVPVIIRKCNWERTPVAKLMVLPKNCKPIAEWPDKDQYYADVATSLFDALDELLGSPDGAKTTLWDLKSQTLPQASPVVATPLVPLRNMSEAASKTGAVSGKPHPFSNGRPIATASGKTNPELAVVPRVSVTVPTSSGDYCKLVKATKLKIVVCFVHPERRHKLLPLKKWSQQEAEPLFDKQTIRIVEARDLKDAVRIYSEEPDTSILLLDGFEPGSPQLDELTETVEWKSKIESVVNSPEWHQFSAPTLSASILQPRQSVSSDETLYSSLRKSLLRIRTRKIATARVLNTPDELAAYFDLRYRVWSELNYLSEEKKCPECPWELDYTDRTSLPLGLFSSIDGSLLGGARLVRGFGEDEPRIIHTVKTMLNDRPVRLQKNFENPTSITHPFDILGEMDRFKEYYRELVRNRTPKAELSRVVVAPEYRKIGLGEIIVDTMCALARSNAIRVVFLACKSEHADFYKRSQFKVVDGVEGNKFLTYQVSCIAMERRV